MLPDDSTEELYHYGVLGMKWGVRKQKKSSGKKKSLVSKLKDKTASSNKNQNRKSSNKPKKMTDDELKKAIARLQLEKQYKDLKKSQIKEGNKLVMEILRGSTKNIGEQLATYGMGTLINKLLKEEIVNPKKGQKK